MVIDWDSFNASLQEDSCPIKYGILLGALWWEAKGDWKKAHQLVDSLTTADAAWVHAYLHRVEGDLSNAGYWYRRASRKQPVCSLEEERRDLVEHFAGS
jgi:hypothetical protein